MAMFPVTARCTRVPGLRASSKSLSTNCLTHRNRLCCDSTSWLAGSAHEGQVFRRGGLLECYRRDQKGDIILALDTTTVVAIQLSHCPQAEATMLQPARYRRAESAAPVGGVIRGERRLRTQRGNLQRSSTFRMGHSNSAKVFGDWLAVYVEMPERQPRLLEC